MITVKCHFKVSFVKDGMAICALVKQTKNTKKSKYQDVPGGPVAKTPHSQCSRTRFDPWSGN